MKLLFCADCYDAVKLQRDDRECKCGKARGRYLDDGRRAVVNEHAHVIGLANPDVLHAVQHAFGKDSGYRTIRAWLMGRDAPRVEWQQRHRKAG